MLTLQNSNFAARRSTFAFVLSVVWTELTYLSFLLRGRENMAANTSIVALFDDIVASTNILTAGSEGSKSLAAKDVLRGQLHVLPRVY